MVKQRNLKMIGIGIMIISVVFMVASLTGTIPFALQSLCQPGETRCMGTIPLVCEDVPNGESPHYIFVEKEQQVGLCGVECLGPGEPGECIDSRWMCDIYLQCVPTSTGAIDIINEKNAIIESLELDLNEKITLISNLEIDLDEKIEIINDLENQKRNRTIGFGAVVFLIGGGLFLAGRKK